MIHLILFSILLGSSSSVPATPINLVSGFLRSFDTQKPMDFMKLFSTLSMPVCFDKCLPQVEAVTRVMKEDTLQPAVLSELCKSIQETAQCSTSSGCGSSYADTISKLFQFICLENIENLGESIECVKNAIADLQPECESHCQVQANLLTDMAKKNVASFVENQNLCNSSLCLAHCFKDRVSKKCDGSKNMAEALLDSFIHGNGYTFDDAMNWIMPQSCRDQNLEFTEPTDASPNRPLSVGNQLGHPNDFSTNFERGPSGHRPLSGLRTVPKNNVNQSTSLETSLLVDGELRILKCSMTDLQSNPVAIPDLETLAMILNDRVQRELNYTSEVSIKGLLEKIKTSHKTEDAAKESSKTDKPCIAEQKTNSITERLRFMIVMLSLAMWIYEMIHFY